MSDNHPCRPWAAFIQENFTVLVLLFLVVMSFGATLLIMHEQKEPDEYAKWAQGFTAGLLTSLTLAMKAPDKPHALAPGTTEATLRTEPPAPIVLTPTKEETKT